MTQQKNVWLVVLAIIITAIVVGSGVYLWQNLKLDQQITDSQEIATQPSVEAPVEEKTILSKEEVCVEDFQKQKVASEPYPKYTLSKSELDNFKNIMGISSFCISQKLGQLFLNVDWDSESPDVSFKADSGRMISLGFKNLFEGSGWGNGYIVYSTYNFVIGTEYDVYATQSDYQEIRDGKKNNVLEVNGTKGFVQYKWHSTFGIIQKKLLSFLLKTIMSL